MGLSLNANTLIRLIKQAAHDAVVAGNPFAMKRGVVVNTEPLQISINQKIIIPQTQLLLTAAVRDQIMTVVEDGQRKEVAVELGLNTGDSVLLLQCDGGQQYIVLDRLEAS